MCADVSRGEPPHSWGFGSDTVDETPLVKDLPCFVTPELNSSRQLRSNTEFESRFSHYIMLCEPEVKLRTQDCIFNLRDGDGVHIWDEDEDGQPIAAEVVAVLPHRGFNHTTNMAEYRLRLIGEG